MSNFVLDFIRKQLDSEKARFWPMVGRLRSDSLKSIYDTSYELPFPFLIFHEFSDHKRYLSYEFIQFCLNNGGKAYFLIHDYNLPESLNYSILEFDINYSGNMETRCFNKRNHPSVYEAIYLTTHDGKRIAIGMTGMSGFEYEKTSDFVSRIVHLTLIDNYSGKARSNSYLNDIPICDVMGSRLYEGDVFVFTTSKNYNKDVTELGVIKSIHAYGVRYESIILDAGGELSSNNKRRTITFEEEKKKILETSQGSMFCFPYILKAPENIRELVVLWKLSQ